VVLVVAQKEKDGVHSEQERSVERSSGLPGCPRARGREGGRKKERKKERKERKKRKEKKKRREKHGMVRRLQGEVACHSQHNSKHGLSTVSVQVHTPFSVLRPPSSVVSHPSTERREPASRSRERHSRSQSRQHQYQHPHDKGRIESSRTDSPLLFACIPAADFLAEALAMAADDDDD
jgi:hypothetical protein